MCFLLGFGLGVIDVWVAEHLFTHDGKETLRGRSKGWLQGKGGLIELTRLTPVLLKHT